MHVLMAVDPVMAQLAAQRLHNGQRINQRIILLKSLRGVSYKRVDEAECDIATGFGEIMIDCLLSIQPRQFARDHGKRLHEAACWLTLARSPAK